MISTNLIILIQNDQIGRNMLIAFCLGFAWITSRFLIRREERKGKEGKKNERKRKGKEQERKRKGKRCKAKQTCPSILNPKQLFGPINLTHVDTKFVGGAQYKILQDRITQSAPQSGKFGCCKIPANCLLKSLSVLQTNLEVWLGKINVPITKALAIRLPAAVFLFLK